jgi:hypothetical protein
VLVVLVPTCEIAYQGTIRALIHHFMGHVIATGYGIFVREILETLGLYLELCRPSGQPLNPFLDRGMSRKQAGKIHPDHWLHYEQMGS